MLKLAFTLYEVDPWSLKKNFSLIFSTCSNPDAAPSSRCWPRSQGYTLGGENSRLNRKTLIGILCLFLVFVVVLAIIIFAVTRDSVGTLEAQDEELGIQLHERDRSLRLHGEDLTLYGEHDSTKKPVEDRTLKKQENDKRYLKELCFVACPRLGLV